MHVVALFNLKGGVGKTSSAVNLADMAAREGCRTLLWDLDAQGGATYILRRKRLKSGVAKSFRKGSPLSALVRPTLYERLSLLPASPANARLDVLLDRSSARRKLLRRLVDPLSEAFDILVLDCPPSLAGLAEQVLVASHLVLTPIVPAPLSVNAFEQVSGHLHDHGVKPGKLRPFFNLVDRRRALHREWIRRPPAPLLRCFDSVIPAAAAVERMSLRREPIAAFDPVSPAAVAYRRLWQEAIEWLEQRQR